MDLLVLFIESKGLIIFSPILNQVLNHFKVKRVLLGART